MTNPRLPLVSHCRCTNQHSKILCGLGLTALLTISLEQAAASGFQLSDHSITSLGRNHAGYGIVGDDASAVQFNPAGLTLLTTKQAQFGFTVNSVSAEVENDGSNVFGGGIAGPNEDGTASVSAAPNLYYVQPINDKLVFGVGLTSPFGTNTDYDNDFFGRFSGTETNLTTVCLLYTSPSPRDRG